MSRASLRDRRLRRRLASQAARDLLPPAPERFARFGTGSYLVPPVRVHNPQYVEIGDGVVVMETGFISAESSPGGPPPRLVIGDRANISPGFTIAAIGEVIVGADCLIGARVFIGDASHAFEDPSRPISEQGMEPGQGVHIGDGTFIGVNSLILPGARIGRGVMVGAGAVVGAIEVPDHCVVVGNPARIVRRYEPDAGWVRC